MRKKNCSGGIQFQTQKIRKGLRNPKDKKGVEKYVQSNYVGSLTLEMHSSRFELTTLALQNQHERYTQSAPLDHYTTAAFVQG